MLLPIASFVVLSNEILVYGSCFAQSNNCVLTVQTIFSQLGMLGACLVRKEAIVSPLSGL